MTEIEVRERLTRTETEIKSLQEGAVRMEKKLDRFQYWFMGLMGTSILSLLLLVANLLERRG